MDNQDTSPHDLFPEKKAGLFEKLFSLFTDLFSEKETNGAGYLHTILHRQREKLKIASKHKKAGPAQLIVDQGVLKNVQIGNQTVSVYSHPNLGSAHDDVRQIKSGS